ADVRSTSFANASDRCPGYCTDRARVTGPVGASAFVVNRRVSEIAVGWPVVSRCVKIGKFASDRGGSTIGKRTLSAKRNWSDKNVAVSIVSVSQPLFASVIEMYRSGSQSALEPKSIARVESAASREPGPTRAIN